ncbi:MAG: hypothetical protein ACI8S6_004302 [Myxococcota bacterium]|jgi:hypothetical protein
MRRPATAEIVALLLSVVAGFLATAPVWLAPGELVVTTHFTDGHLAGAAAAARGLWSGELLQLRTSAAGYPDGVMFRPLLWPVMLLAGLVGPVLALNLSWALAPAASTTGGLLLGRALKTSPAGGAALGMLLGWCTWMRVTLGNGQIEQAGLGAIAAVWAAAIVAEEGSRWRVVLAPLTLLAVGLAAPNCGLAAALGLGMLAVGRTVQSPSRAWRLGAVLLLCLVATLLVHAYHAPNYSDLPNFFQPRLHPPPGHDPTNYGVPSGWLATATHQLDDADWRALLVPAGPDAYGSVVQHVPFLGGTLMLAALLSVLRAPGRVWPLLIAAVGMASLSMGEQATFFGQRFFMPYHLITLIAPSAASSGSAYRLAMAAIVALAAAAAVGLDPRSRRQQVGLGLLVALAWTEATLLPGRPLPLPARPVALHPALSALAGPSSPVLDLPLPLRGSCDAQTAHYFNATLAHGRPLLHTLAAGPNYFDNDQKIRELNRLFRHSQCSARLTALLDELAVGAVVLHTEDPCVPGEEVYRCLCAALGEPSSAEGIFWWSR